MVSTNPESVAAAAEREARRWQERAEWLLWLDARDSTDRRSDAALPRLAS